MRVPHSSIPTKELSNLRARIAELEAKPEYPADIDLIKRTATEAALRWAWHNQSLDLKPYIKRGLKALLGEGDA